MRDLARYLVLAAFLTGSVAHAGPARHRGRVAKKATREAEVDRSDDRSGRSWRRAEAAREDDDDDEVDDDRPYADEGDDRDPRYARDRDRDDDDRRPIDRERDRRRVDRDRDDRDDDRRYDDDEDGDRADTIDRRMTLRSTGRAKAWHLAIGPYLWASSVDTDVALGSAHFGSSSDFMETQRNARYGVEAIAEARYRRFAITGDLMYGVVDLTGGTEVGPLDVAVNGTASSLLVDGGAGYMVLGNDDAPLSLEARGGIRYQRTQVEGAVGIGGSDVASTKQIVASRDALAGARVFLRPFRRLCLSGTADVGVLGTSSLTWSAEADASVRITNHVRLSVGWRTLTLQGSKISMLMHGPRAAVQLLF